MASNRIKPLLPRVWDLLWQLNRVMKTVIKMTCVKSIQKFKWNHVMYQLRSRIIVGDD